MRPLDPATTALVTMECQRGVIGDLAGFPTVAEAANDAGLVEAVIALARVVRSAGGMVVHAVVEVDQARVGTPSNAPLLRAAERSPVQLVGGTDPAQLVSGLWGEGDVVSSRRTGVSPWGPTDLAATLAARGVQVVIAAGASLNVGIAGLCIGAVDHGYEVVVASDATIAVPRDIEDALLNATIAPLARIASVEEISQALTARPL